MDFLSVETEYRQLKAQFDAGQLTEAGFKARLQDLMLEDEQDRWWMIGYETGQWYVHDGEKWVAAEPPRLPAPPSAEVRSPGLPDSGQKAKEVPVEAPTASAAGRAAPVPVEIPASEPIRPRNASRWLLAGLVAVVVLAVAIGIGLRGGGPTIGVESPTVTGTLTPSLTLSPSVEMVRVPAGEFLMGSPEGQGESDEHPYHTVYLDAFSIDKTEVTAVQYQRCVEAGACSVADTGDYCTYGAVAKSDHPINCVDWDQGVAFCRWAGKRLPTEAEWEKAARGTDGRVYPWGNAWDAGKLNSADGGPATTTSVGSYSAGASSFGALDMAGNVWEWVADWYGDGYYGQSPRENPQGPASGAWRVLRGRSWAYVTDTRVASRYRFAPHYRIADIGFRCARSP